MCIDNVRAALGSVSRSLTVIILLISEYSYGHFRFFNKFLRSQIWLWNRQIFLVWKQRNSAHVSQSLNPIHSSSRHDLILSRGYSLPKKGITDVKLQALFRVLMNVGGFHLHILIVPFFYQFHFRIETAAYSSLSLIAFAVLKWDDCLSVSVSFKLLVHISCF